MIPSRLDRPESGPSSGAGGGQLVRARRATPDDVPALVRLRGLMLAGMGVETGGPDAPWRTAWAHWFTERLHQPGLFAAFLVDDPALGVVSSAVGTCDAHAPGPANLSGLQGARLQRQHRPPPAPSWSCPGLPRRPARLVP